jgi:hypothetical protein
MRIFNDLLAALIGATITTFVQFLFFLRAGSKTDPVALVLSASTGAIIGWGYQLAKGLRTVTEEALARLETTTRVLDFQEEPLKMLTKTEKHAQTIGLLLRDSMREKYRFISYIDENKYLSYLKSAISESRKCESIQRRPMRWFKEAQDAKTYLNTLRDKDMEAKIRVFIIDPNDEEQMQNDLANEELLRFYWDNTGTDVKTYWTTTSDLAYFFHNQVHIPPDFALYDEELLIEYGPQTQTLFFDIINSDDSKRDIFKKIEEQGDRDRPFTKINPLHP